MAGEIFISYQRADLARARLLHSLLRAEGVEAWYDALIGVGQDWRTITAMALENSTIFVLLFTANAAQSSDIAKELAAAVQEKKLVVPVRLENIKPRGAFLYELASRNWIDAYEHTEAELAELAKGLAHLIKTGAPDASVLQYERSAKEPSHVADPGGRVSPERAPQIDAAVPAPGSKISLTVLPLKNLSQDSSQVYFSDGQTDAIITALTQVQGLAVIAPQSAFLIGNQSVDLHTVRQLLHVSYTVEGSVQWEDHQVRVVARLTDLLDGTIKWAQSFNRDYTNVMALQEEIAALISAKVKDTLGLTGVSARAQPLPQLSDTAGTMLLQARAQLRRRAEFEPGGPLTSAAKLFEGVLDEKPDYLPAMAALIHVYGLIPVFHTLFAVKDTAQVKSVADEWIPKAEKMAAKAFDLAPKIPSVLIGMGLAKNLRGNLTSAAGFFQQAFAASPNSTEVLHLCSLFLMNVGRVREAAVLRKKLQGLEPLVPVYFAFNADAAWLDGDNDAALKMIQTSMAPIAVAHPFIARQYALIYASMGEFRQASDAILRASVTYDAEKVNAASQILLAADSERMEASDLGFFDIINVYSRTPDRALAYFEANVEAGLWPATETPQYWHPGKEYVTLRNTPRFRSLLQRTQLSQYWQEHTKPDLCIGDRPEDFCP